MAMSKQRLDRLISQAVERVQDRPSEYDGIVWALRELAGVPITAGQFSDVLHERLECTRGGIFTPSKAYAYRLARTIADIRDGGL